jgi:magnesium transporter
MITLYRANGDVLVISAHQGGNELPSDVIWMDLYSPDRHEDMFVEKLLGIQVPTREDLKDIEPSSRLYVEGEAVFMTASILYRSASTTPELADIAFILTGNKLVTIRYAQPKSFDIFIAGWKRACGTYRNGEHVMARLMETIVDRAAELLEHSVSGVDQLSAQVFGAGAVDVKRKPRFLEDRLMDIGQQHRMVAKARDSLMSLSRLLTFLYTVPSVQEDKEIRELCRTVSRDIQSLSEHAAFISGNVTFLLDASLGLINLEQNSIIKIFSIASVVFLPPTLVASVYGMNFKYMPELETMMGYPASLVGMAVSAIIPFLFFRWKGWL